MSNKFLDIVSSMIDKRIKESTINREPATVISVDSTYKRAVVQFLNGSRFALLNKTGEKLYQGDSVWVEYNKLPAGGYIAIRNGEAEPLSGGGGLVLRNGIVVTADQSGVYAQQASSQQAINVRNLENTYYGSLNDPIIVQGNLMSSPKATPRIESGDYQGWYDYSAYAPILTDKLILNGDIYTLQLTQSSETNRTYNVYKNGVQMRTGSYYSTSHNTISFIPGTHNYRVCFVPVYNRLLSPDDTYNYGYAGLTSIAIQWFDGCFSTNNTIGELTDAPGAGPSSNTLTTQEFASQAEYDYAVNLTTHTSLPPSLGE